MEAEEELRIEGAVKDGKKESRRKKKE